MPIKGLGKFLVSVADRRDVSNNKDVFDEYDTDEGSVQAGAHNVRKRVRRG